MLLRSQAAGATSIAVSRRAIGRASSSTGKAISQDRPQAPGQPCRKAGVGPSTRKVEIPDTIRVIKPERIRGVTNAP